MRRGEQVRDTVRGGRGGNEGRGGGGTGEEQVRSCCRGRWEGVDCSLPLRHVLLLLLLLPVCVCEGHPEVFVNSGGRKVKVIT